MLKKDHWDATLYDNSHAFVSNYGKGVVELLDPKEGERILDLGCGTGDLSNELHQLGVSVVGVDRSENMIQQAREKFGQLTFKVSDALNLKYEHEFDAVFSNAVLHWVKEPKLALEGIYRSLKQGGRFVAEFGGKDNIQTITNALKDQFDDAGIDFTDERFPWYYPSIGEYTTLMEEVGFRVVFAAHIDRPTPLTGDDGLRHWLDMFTGSMFAGLSDETKQSILEKVEANLKDVLFKGNEWVLDYKRLRVIGIKE